MHSELHLQRSERKTDMAVFAEAPRWTEVRGVRSHTVLFAAFVGGLAWTPFLYGSNDLLAWGINAIVFPGLAVILEANALFRGERRAMGIRQLAIPAALFLAVVIWIIIQNTTWTPNSWHHPIWAMAGDALQRPIEGSISVNRDLTALALLRLITAASVFWIAMQLSFDATRAYQFVIAIVVIISGYAVYGLISFSLTPLDSSLHRYMNSTFINRNHFSTYAGMGFVASCGLILRHYENEVLTGDGSLRFRIASFIEATGGRMVIYLACASLTLAGVLLSGSRGGVIATVLGSCALGILSVRRQKIHFIRGWGTILLGASVFVAAFLAFGEVFVSKVAERGLIDENRLGIYVITLRSILDAPMLGYGYGTFADILPMIRDQSIGVEGALDQAHNTYLEVFQGLGLVFGSMLVGCVAILVLKCLKGAIMRRTQAVIPSIAVSVAVLAGVHALADFSLQMQAVALTFMALLGAGVAQSASS